MLVMSLQPETIIPRKLEEKTPLFIDRSDTSNESSLCTEDERNRMNGEPVDPIIASAFFIESPGNVGTNVPNIKSEKSQEKPPRIVAYAKLAVRAITMNPRAVAILETSLVRTQVPTALMKTACDNTL